jgi:carboxypeptidase C (cathepsin A)
MKTAYWISGGCRDYILYCKASDKRTVEGQKTCEFATNICRNLVEGPYYDFGGRGVYDIRHPYDDPTPPDNFEYYLNTAEVQNALGVNINYTSTSSPWVGRGFAKTGDFVYRRFQADLERILNNDVRVALIYGDADYICNWFGGEAASLKLRYKNAKQFEEAGYVPFMVNGKEYGEVREYGRFSFLRVYEAGHEVPYYQPEASLEMFRRVLGNLILADGSGPITPDYETGGTAEATHTNSFVPLPSSSSSLAASISSEAPRLW